MATTAVAQETVFALRRKIAKIEGRLPNVSGGEEQVGCRRGDKASPSRRSVVPDPVFLPPAPNASTQPWAAACRNAALTEIHGRGNTRRRRP